MHTANCSLSESFEVCFESLFVAGRGLAFPSDSCGHVDLDALPPRARHNYLYARALIGRDFAFPHVRVAASRAATTRPQLEVSFQTCTAPVPPPSQVK